MFRSFSSRGVLEHHVEAFLIILKYRVMHHLDIFGSIYFILLYIII